MSAPLRFLSPASFWSPDYICPSAWIEHAPFAFWLCDVLRPRCFVELGTHFGYSYFAFCQAIDRLALGTVAHAVDTWRGDEHAGFYDETVFQAVSEQNTKKYAAFSRLIRSTFDDALSNFEDGSIDLLHIDGRHFYDDVKHDFESWRPKLTDNAIVLFHDTSVRERGFGVWRFFEELSASRPAFQFYHGYGLGVLVMGEVPAVLAPLFESSNKEADRVRSVYTALGGALWARVLQEARLAEQSTALAERDARLAEQSAALIEKDARLAEQSTSLADLNARFAEQDARLAGKDARLAEQDARLIEKDAYIAEQDARLAEKSEQAAEYLYHLDRINAWGWFRLGLSLDRVIRSPLTLFSLRGSKQVPKSGETNAQFEAHVQNTEPNQAIVTRPPSRRNLREEFLLSHGGDEIYFPQVMEPEVSIIIPAYGGLPDLETCLRSLSVNRVTEPSFEVIVLDDCPEKPVLSAIPSSAGLTKVANDKNYGFLLTCNRGASIARGRVLCFLNSDTIVTTGWLRSLVEALNEVPRAAIVGGMLLNVDGTIQDAGWRILGNGWGYPVGRGSDPRNGSYTYRRLVDCVTGACFVVSQKVWNELGGFDTAYAPAYYEEFDFAFRAQARGLVVVYEPRSRILHLDAASYGAEERNRLSTINHAKFCERFAEALRKHPYETPDEFTLRHAVDEGPVLLVIDLSVPQPDQHAGDVVMSKYLAMFATAGWRVVFGPMNGRAEGPAAEALERQGIELIRAPVTIEGWLTNHGKHVREVWLARPEVAEKVLTLLRTHTDANITYYTHDLHHLRLQRQADLQVDPKLKVEAAKVKDLECKIFHGVDHVTTPSVAEVEIVRQLSPDVPVTVLPLYHCDVGEIRTHNAQHFNGLFDVAFVGGFPHTPNVDAALFIANEVMPLVWRECSEARLLLIGYAPPEEVRALAGPRILVTGQVPRLEPFFDSSRVFLGALRYGAGVKGKILEAMRLGLPVVTTPVGAEGIGIVPGVHAIVAEDTSALARGVLDLLSDAELCAALSKAGAEFVRHQFSIAAARNALNEVFRTPRCSVCGSDRLIAPPLEGNYREALVCHNCFALGRTAALAKVLLRRLARDGEGSLAELARRRSDLCIHELGFVGGIAEALRGQPGYTVSEYFDGVLPGTAGPGGIRCEDVTRLTFPDESFCVVISQDVMEHVPDPARAFAEIARVLKLGGSHIFTVPQDQSLSRSVTRARLTNDGLEQVLPAVYHGDPIRIDGSLVFTDFGKDLGKMCEVAGLRLIEHEFPVLGGGPFHMLRVFEAVKATVDGSYSLSV